MYWNVLELCGLAVLGVTFGRLNIALRKTVYQSSTLDYNGYLWKADLAVDNVTEFTGDGCRCCAGAGYEYPAKGPWWEVDLGSVVRVGKVKVFGRSDIGYTQLYGFKMFASETTPYNISTSQYVYINNVTSQEYLANQGVTDVLFGDTPIRYVALALHDQNTNVLMMVCEVQVFMACDNYRFEPDCAQCHCDGAPCNKASGVCPGGCTPGWKGQRCDQTCPMSSYGENCSVACGHCYGDGACNHVTGICRSCAAGFHGELCISACSPGTYGLDCKSHCGNCLDKSACDITSGRCLRGCMPGYVGDHCKDEKIYASNTYSVDCVPCGHCLQGDACDIVTGFCPRGCETTHDGDHCTGQKAKVHAESVLIGVGVCLVGLALISGTVVGIRYALQKRLSVREDHLAGESDVKGQSLYDEPAAASDMKGQSVYEQPARASDGQDEHHYCAVVEYNAGAVAMY